MKYCLLCGEGTCKNEDKTSKLEGIVGGVGYKLLERQLEKMFILLKVLEVPLNWCEGILQRGDGGGDGGDNNPEEWFTLCDSCVEGKVTRAWNTYQKMLTWQTRMLSVRLQIREGMRRSILKSNHGQVKSQVDGLGEGGRNNHVDCEIKKYLFPGESSVELNY